MTTLNIDFIQLKKQLHRASFYEYFKDFWAEGGNTTEFQHEDALKVLCDHLQARYEGKLGFKQLRNMAVAIPPSSCKTAIIGVAYQSWIWGACNDPGYTIIYAAYNETLAKVATEKFFQLINSAKFKKYYGDNFKITTKEVTNISNNKGGRRIATGIAGVATGYRCHEMIIDDPLKSQDGHSELMQKQVKAFLNASASRYINPDTYRMLVVAQRLSENDGIGQALALGFYLLKLPIEYDPDDAEPPSPIGWVDKRTQRGELLFKRITAEKVKELKESMGVDFDAQYNQKPIVAKGNIIKSSTIRQTALESFKKGLKLMSIDSAYKAKKTSDDSAYSFHYVNSKTMMNYKGWAGKMDYAELKEHLIQVIKDEKPDIVIIEDRASGTSLLSDLKELGLPTIIEGVQATIEKAYRAHRANVHITKGHFYLNSDPDNSLYTRRVIRDLSRFPGGKNIDLADSIIQAVNYVADRWGFEKLEEEEKQNIEENKEQQRQSYLDYRDRRNAAIELPEFDRLKGVEAVERLQNIYLKYQ